MRGFVFGGDGVFFVLFFCMMVQWGWIFWILWIMLFGLP